MLERLRRPSVLSAFRLVLIALWCGLTWTIGYVVAPTLFRMLDNPALAGNLAGALFRFQAYASLLIGVLIMCLSARAPGPRDAHRRLRSQTDVRLALAMLLANLLGYFALQPFMHAAREAMAADYAMAHGRFAALHAASAVAYLMQSVLGLWLLMRQSGPAPVNPANAAS
jgi:hypothetical protein